MFLHDRLSIGVFLDTYLAFALAVVYGSGRRTPSVLRVAYGLAWPLTLIGVWPILALIQVHNQPDPDDAVMMKYIWTLEGLWFSVILDWKIGSTPNFVRFLLGGHSAQVKTVSWIIIGLVLFGGALLGWAVRTADPAARELKLWQKLGMSVIMPLSYIYWIWEGRGYRFVAATLILWASVLLDWKLGGSGDTIRAIRAWYK